jgi:pimeloyl-ACP methyl ester carboxylesterase
MSQTITPFHLHATDAELEDLRSRLRRTRWPERATVSDWSQGVPLDYLQEICRYWAGDYDWRAREALINRFNQYRTEIDGLGIHFLHVRSREQDALPLILTHGWPGSIVEFLDVIEPLVDPVAHGGKAADAFHLVIPSLPGFGWSDRPSEPGWGVPHIAQAWAALMAGLGYQRYGAQGGDWGAGVTTVLGQRDPDHLVGIHLNMLTLGPPLEQTEFEEDELVALDAIRHYVEVESGYSKQQGTRPQTVGYGLADSPAGQCAWILEKFHNWADCGGDPVAALGADRLLDNVMAYWVPGTGASSGRIYWETYRDPAYGLQADGWGRVDVPVGASLFAKELFKGTRSWAERVYGDLRYWNSLDKGGHFAAFEQPALFVDEVRKFFRLVR